ncbi:MAG: hypothetical protein II887_04980 [Bacteroidales bacterium]|nr:hypothetical protein [Bacteroidales bacterium]
MKKLSTIIMALALVLGMSQCKKQETPTNGDSGEKVYVTLNVNNGESLDVNVNDNGSRHAVAPNLGVIQFRNGDVLYVGNSGRYIGQLTYTNGAFSGELELPTGNDYLHFYFLGGKAPETEIEAGTTTDFTINIADQSQNLPVLCYGHSSQPYTATATNYSAVLEYKCALVRFNLEKQVYMNVNLSNVLTEATIDFVHNAITPTATTGTMTLYGEEGVITHRWGILLPGTTLTGNSDLVWQGTGSMPTIVANGYVDAGVGAGFLIHNPSIPAPSLTDAVHSGNNLSVFSVSPTQKVYFSKANLKRTPDSDTWEFHNSQVEECYGQPEFKYLAGTIESIKQSNYSNGPLINIYQSSMDRFCWGYYTGSSAPFMDVSSTDYVTGRKDLSRTLGTDWGCAFPNAYWRTPTASEWDYLLNNTARGDKRFMLVRFFNSDPLEGEQTEGLLLFPDNFVEPEDLHETWTNPYTGKVITFFSSSWYNQTDQYYLIDRLTWDSSGDGVCTQSNSNMYKLLAAGAVFLPAVGVRSGNGGYYYKYNYYVTCTNNSDFHGQGYYWSASFNGTDRSAQYLWFGIHGSKYQGDSSQPTVTEYVGVNNPNLSRDQGCCVRLVWDAN